MTLGAYAFLTLCFIPPPGFRFARSTSRYGNYCGSFGWIALSSAENQCVADLECHLHSSSAMKSSEAQGAKAVPLANPRK